MSLTLHIAVQSEDFDPAVEAARLTGGGRPGVGALVQFTGFCRDEGGRLSALELEHYPGMAEAELQRIAEDAVGASRSSGFPSSTAMARSCLASGSCWSAPRLRIGRPLSTARIMSWIS